MRKLEKLLKYFNNFYYLFSLIFTFLLKKYKSYNHNYNYNY